MQQRKPKRPGLKREDIERGPRSVMGAPGVGLEMEVGEQTSTRPEDSQIPPKGERPSKRRERR